MMLTEKKIKFAKSKFGRIEFRFDEGIANREGGDWVENKVSALLDGKEIGYLKINYIPKSVFQSRYKDILRFIVVQHGAQELNDAIKSGDTKQIVVKMAELTGIRHSISTDSNKDDIEWWKTQYSEIMKKLNAKYGKEFKKFYEYWVDKPMIDYIQVDDKYKHGGVGFGLYIAGAMWMAEKGFPLRSGYGQSELAKKAWGRMERVGLPVKTVKDAGVTRKALDYR